MQPEAGLQASVVHAFPSPQLTGSNTQPVARSQLSLVQALLSAQVSAGPPMHAPVASHLSAVVHASPSLQVAPGVGV